MSILLLIIIAIAVVLGVPDFRKQLVTRPVFRVFKRILPPMSTTEREAMEAGDVWWDAELFKGKPDWRQLHNYPKPSLNDEERAFLDNQVETLLAMLDDYSIVHEQKDLPQDVWDYLKQEGFFALIIPKSFGGREFSAIANSTIVSKIASRSLSAAVTVMVPNSLGPGELLMHYGTQQQKERWLPTLADGRDVPCFALTGPEAGSDAGSIPDLGIVCKGEFEGKETLGIMLNWNKRYITLAPVATVLGLAFKLRDPDGLMGDQEDLGITCALIPTDHPGVETGRRHNPLALAFMNGPTTGKDVFIPLDWIIGGPDYAGRGWRMLVECLSAGRGISLPALSAASGHLAAKMTSAYAYVRRQFGMSIGRFEGIQEPLARIGAFAYSLEAHRRMTAGAIDLNISPSVITAISKYHMTEMARKVVDDAMDIHAGKGIQMGPLNYLGNAYMGIPISITVEGANILTRNLMIFGQGATRCHPYVFAEMEAAANPDEGEGLNQFDGLLVKHVAYAAGNFTRAVWQGITGARFNASPVAGETSRYYRDLTRMSTGLAVVSDMAMLVLGGELKRREMISARLGDILSHLYMASATLKRFEEDGHQVSDLPFVHYCLQHHLHAIGVAFDGFFANFSNPILSTILKRIIFPWGIRYKAPKDKVATQICSSMLKPGVLRERLSHLCYVGAGEDDATGVMERAFVAMFESQSLEKRLGKAQRAGRLPKRIPFAELIEHAFAAKLIDDKEAAQLREAEALRYHAIQVDSFNEMGATQSPAVPFNADAA
ncbi:MULTISPECIES: acyl-CoA dehydrogenase [Corallincola]|uniref:Acyl-coenzyme A dehydrogenase n=2 Tax=Corallincola TaxID=1775176 RepID=A0ABY1WUP7_9GAMM|nr:MULTISPECIES: acyl-CoA dehydrogenase [Corallincola]TAA48476.1 acyl-CoA dehydrogenase [Corallincola spongiicola]TCI01841.1 acyl-CoA dehydrogenase [Corallincola luteus]